MSVPVFFSNRRAWFIKSAWNRPPTIPAVRADIKVLVCRVKVFVALPLRQAWLQMAGFVSVSPLWGLVGCGVLWLQCSVLVFAFVSIAAFWSVLWADANAPRVAKFRTQCFSQDTCRRPFRHFAAFLSPIPTLHTAPCPPCPTSPRRCVPSTSPPPSADALPSLLSFSCNAPVDSQRPRF